MKIVVYGSGYVGLANGLMLARNNNVIIIDINKERIDKLTNKKIVLEEKMAQEELQVTNAKFMLKNEFIKSDLYILALPTNYDEKENKFNTNILDKQIIEIRENDSKAIIIIKSTIPIGYVDDYKMDNIIFAPEFLREGSSLEDCLNPSRVIIGTINKKFH